MFARLLICTLPFLVPVASIAQPIANGLQLYYKFNGDAADFLPNGFDGLVNGAVLVPDEAMNPNSAYFFDGGNDFIDMSRPKKG